MLIILERSGRIGSKFVCFGASLCWKLIIALFSLLTAVLFKLFIVGVGWGEDLKIAVLVTMS